MNGVARDRFQLPVKGNQRREKMDFFHPLSPPSRASRSCEIGESRVFIRGTLLSLSLSLSLSLYIYIYIYIYLEGVG